MAAFSELGAGPFSSVRSATTTGAPATEPSAPTLFRLSDVGSGQITIAWAAPVDDGGAPVTGYEWQMDICAPGNCLLNDPKRGRTTDSSATISDLSVDGRYLLRVRAINGVGAGQWTSAIRPTLRPSTSARVLVSPTTITVDEGATATYTIRLASDPLHDYTVWTSPETDGIYSDVDLNEGWVQVGPSDWSQGLTVTFTAPEDSDTNDGVALIRNWVQLDCNRATDPATCQEDWKDSPYRILDGAHTLVTIVDND